MSTPEALAIIKQTIENTLNEYTRGSLDKVVHVIDISYKSLLASNKRNSTAKYENNYKEFLLIARNSANIVTDYLEGITKVNANRGTCLLEENGSILLISKNFNTARDFITKVSNLIKENDDFGISFRSRNYEEIESSRDLARAKGSQFIQRGPEGYSVYIIEKMPGSSKYGLVLIPELSDIKEVQYLAQRRSTKLTKTTSLAKFNNMEVEVGIDGTISIKERLLSVLDLGHGQGESAIQATPLGVKLSNLLELGLSPEGRALVDTYKAELVKLHNIINFEFKNTSTDKKASGYVVLSIQNYKRNNVLSVAEAAIMVKLRKNIEQLLPNIPGSNTIIQDGVEILKNRIVSSISGKPPKSIIKHSNKVEGKASPKTTIANANSSTVKAPRAKVIVVAKPIRTISTNQTYSLASLQLLINTHLQDVISANMGSGSARNILNYQTGRFAASAKVERMSQSREGMITAFYSYMKNPYQTFEPGYHQGSPKTRDPKLLIAGSIRDIAASKVGNRMRAVLL